MRRRLKYQWFKVKRNETVQEVWETSKVDILIQLFAVSLLVVMIIWEVAKDALL